MKYLLFFLIMIPALLSSAFLFQVFGWLGYCGATDCLGTGNASASNRVLGVAVVAASSVPLLSVLFLLLQTYRKKALGPAGSFFMWAVILCTGLLGAVQVGIDPGDASWAGLPLIAFSVFFALGVWTRPAP